MNNKGIHMAAFILLVVGGLNWLLVAFGFNVIELVLGGIPYVVQVIYVLVGLAAIYELVSHKSCCKSCSKGGGDMGGGSPVNPQI